MQTAEGKATERRRAQPPFFSACRKAGVRSSCAGLRSQTRRQPVFESKSSKLCGHLMPRQETGKPRPRMQSPGKKVRLRAPATCALGIHDSWVQACVERVAPKAKRCRMERELLQSERPRTHAMTIRCGLRGQSVLEVGMCCPTVMPVIELHIESLRTNRLSGTFQV